MMFSIGDLEPGKEISSFRTDGGIYLQSLRGRNSGQIPQLTSFHSGAETLEEAIKEMVRAWTEARQLQNLPTSEFDYDSVWVRCNDQFYMVARLTSLPGEPYGPWVFGSLAMHKRLLRTIQQEEVW